MVRGGCAEGVRRVWRWCREGVRRVCGGYDEGVRKPQSRAYRTDLVGRARFRSKFDGFVPRTQHLT